MTADPNEPLVELAALAPSIVIDLRYAGSRNLFGRPVYPANRCFLRQGLAERLVRVATYLKGRGRGLKVWDGYRPLSVQRRLWALRPDTRFVADPAQGSNHNRGSAVDATLADDRGDEAVMPSDFDDFSPRAGSGYGNLPAEAIANRALLHEAMRREGIEPIATEWWHFDAPDAKHYPIIDVSFEELIAGTDQGS